MNLRGTPGYKRVEREEEGRAKAVKAKTGQLFLLVDSRGRVAYPVRVLLKAGLGVLSGG